jgi:hypothetical protein
MEETLEGGRGPPRAVAPLEREGERGLILKNSTFCPEFASVFCMNPEQAAVVYLYNIN